MTFSKRVLIYFVIVLIPVIYRYQWNQNSVFISSDPEIKYYQVIQSLQGGSPAECFFPAQKLGFDSVFLPFGYPWAFTLNSEKCVFQYPVLFTWIQKIFVYPSSIWIITYIPILFYFFNFILLDRIIELYDKRTFNIFVSVLLIQCFTPVFLSSLDYSELTITNFFLLLSIFLFNQKDLRYPNISALLISLAIVFNFQLRPESTIALFFYLALCFLLSKEKLGFIKRIIPVILISVVFQIAFSLFNYDTYGHILGMRGLNTMNDMGSSDMNRNLFGGFVADLWGDEFKIGIFKGYPVLLLALVALIVEKKKSELLFLLSGCLFVFLLPFISPYRAGVDIFGMRYYESGVYLLMIGATLTLFNHKWKFYFGIFCLFLLYFCYKSDLRAIKQWTSSSQLYHSVLKQFHELKPDLIVHRGLSLSYLIGESYIKYPQVAIYSNADWNQVEGIAVQKNLRILYLEWEGNHLVNAEFPNSVWKEKFDINFQLNPKLFQIKSMQKIGHFNGYILEKKQ